MEYFEDLGESGDGDQRYAETFEVVKTMKIAAIVLSHLEDCLPFAFELDRGKEMLATNLNALGYSR